MERPTMGYIRIVAYLQRSYQQCKCSVLPWKRQQGVPCAVWSSYEIFRAASPKHVKLPDISDDIKQILSF
jgi:hypothetical protein